MHEKEGCGSCCYYYPLLIFPSVCNRKNPDPRESLISDFFDTEAEGYTITDKSGNDITSKFYSDNLKNYIEKDFDSIIKYLAFYQCTIAEPIEYISTGSSLASKAIENETVIRRYTTLYSSDSSVSPYWEIDWFSYAAIGSYEYDTVSGQIIDASTVLEISTSPGQEVGNCYIITGPVQGTFRAVYDSVRNVNNSVYIASDGESCTFGIMFIAHFSANAAQYRYEHDIYITENFVVRV